MDEEDGLPSFDYLKRFKRPKVQNETISSSSDSVKKPRDEVKSSGAGTWNKETESLKQVANKRAKKQLQKANDMPSTSGVKKKVKRKAKSKTKSADNVVQNTKPLELSFISTLTGVNPETVDYKNLTKEQLEHLIRKLNLFYQNRNKKVRKGKRRNLRSNNTSTTCGKGQIGKSPDSFQDFEKSWKNFHPGLDYLSIYKQQKQMEKELEDRASNTLLSQIDVLNKQEPDENAAAIDLVDLTSYNGPKTIDLTNTLNNAVIYLGDSDEENNYASPVVESNEDVKNGNSSNINDSVQIIQNNTDLDSSWSIEEVFSVPKEDSNQIISMSEPSTSKQETSVEASNTTGESSSTQSTSNTAGQSSEGTSNNRTLFNECPICFDDMTTKRVGATMCGHVFCLDCIQKSLKCSNKCPTCRKTVRKNSVITLFR